MRQGDDNPPLAAVNLEFAATGCKLIGTTGGRRPQANVVQLDIDLRVRPVCALDDRAVVVQSLAIELKDLLRIVRREIRAGLQLAHVNASGQGNGTASILVLKCRGPWVNRHAGLAEAYTRSGHP